eukprot:1812174-Amphidinium_carterae.1
MCQCGMSSIQEIPRGPPPFGWGPLRIYHPQVAVRASALRLIRSFCVLQMPATSDTRRVYVHVYMCFCGESKFVAPFWLWGTIVVLWRHGEAFVAYRLLGSPMVQRNSSLIKEWPRIAVGTLVDSPESPHDCTGRLARFCTQPLMDCHWRACTCA